VAAKLPEWALPPGLDPESIGKAAAEYRALADVTGELKPADFRLPSIGEVMDDIGINSVIDKVSGAVSGAKDRLGKEGAAAALSGLLAASPAGAEAPAPAGPVTVHVSAPITIQAPAGVNAEDLSRLIEERLEAAVKRAAVAARTAHD
jgi:hypothetical protein